MLICFFSTILCSEIYLCSCICGSIFFNAVLHSIVRICHNFFYFHIVGLFLFKAIANFVLMNIIICICAYLRKIFLVRGKCTHTYTHREIQIRVFRKLQGIHAISIFEGPNILTIKKYPKKTSKIRTFLHWEMRSRFLPLTPWCSV